jgi:hypothetical protein
VSPKSCCWREQLLTSSQSPSCLFVLPVLFRTAIRYSYTLHTRDYLRRAELVQLRGVLFRQGVFLTPPEPAQPPARLRIERPLGYTTHPHTASLSLSAKMAHISLSSLLLTLLVYATLMTTVSAFANPFPAPTPAADMANMANLAARQETPSEPFSFFFFYYCYSSNQFQITLIPTPSIWS